MDVPTNKNVYKYLSNHYTSEKLLTIDTYLTVNVFNIFNKFKENHSGYWIPDTTYTIDFTTITTSYASSPDERFLQTFEAFSSGKS